jgi:acyl-CoA thioesterase-1
LFRKSACYASLLFAVHLLAACAPEASTADRTDQRNLAVEAGSATPPQEDGKLVLAFGDSLYAGYGLGAAQGFAPRLEAALRAAGVPASVRNAGVSGDTSAAGRQRLEFTLDGLPRTPDLAIVGLGGNDMLRGIDPAETEANLTAICTTLRKRGIEVMLTGMLAAPNLGRDYGMRFRSLFPRVAKSCGASLYPFFLEGVVTERSLMLGDRIHPSAAGIERIVGKIAPLVAEELRSQPD